MTDFSAAIAAMTDEAKATTSVLAQSSGDARNKALMLAADLLRRQQADILSCNKKDITNAHAEGQNDAFIDRLTLDSARVEAMAKGLEDIAALPDPLGRELASWTRPNGLAISRVATPLGVLGVIYESRPNVTIDAAGLAIKSGNAVILRGGSASIHTATILASIMQQGLDGAGLPPQVVQLVTDPDRGMVGAMLAATGGIDVIIPRGGKSLVERVQRDARVPVFAHLEGICHIYLDAEADLEKARRIIVNAKMRRVGICGAAETLLVDRNIAETMLPAIAEDLIRSGCTLHADHESQQWIAKCESATEADWTTEYLSPDLAVRCVDGVDDAMAHIRHYGSDHTDAIITENPNVAERFLNGVDSAIVMHNASTQFADGGEFGMGAEIGIATGRMHARGPVGADQLTSFKYIVRGSGQIRD